MKITKKSGPVIASCNRKYKIATSLKITSAKAVKASEVEDITADLYEDDDQYWWAKINVKTVMDSDGFTTDYSLYEACKDDADPKFCCVLGDSELYTPYNTEWDAEFDNEKEANEWFETYEGFADEDIEASEEVDAVQFECQEIVQSEVDPEAYEVRCYDRAYDETFDKWVGKPGDPSAVKTVKLLIRDPMFLLEEDLAQELIDLIGVGGIHAAINVESEGVDPEFSEYADDIKEISQEFTSENTSINSTKLPAVFSMVNFQPGTINIDYGGGRFDNVADYLSQYDVVNLVYDPYNRSADHNKEVIRTVKKAGGADTATCSNVLNVIKEHEVRINVLENIKKLVKQSGEVYITVYEGKGTNEGGATKSGYQLNRKTADYLDEIHEVFPDAVRKGRLIIAHPNGAAVESCESVEASESRYHELTKAYERMREFKDRENAEVVDFTDGLTHKGVQWEQYDNITDNGCTVFYDSFEEEDFYADEDVDAEPIEAVTIDQMDIGSEIQQHVAAKAKEVMMSENFGFPVDEVDDYLRVDASFTKMNGEEYLVVEVGAELSYDSMFELGQALNHVVQAYDADAYFDQVDPGIMDAFISVAKLNDELEPVEGKLRILSPATELEPAQYEEPEYRDEEETIEIDMDGLIIDVEEDSDWDFDEDSIKNIIRQMKPENGRIYTDEHHIYISDANGVIEDLQEYIISEIPYNAGKYETRGTVKLVYRVMNIREDIDGDLYLEDVEAEFAEDLSSRTGFRCVEVMEE